MCTTNKKNRQLINRKERIYWRLVNNRSAAKKREFRFPPALRAFKVGGHEKKARVLKPFRIPQIYLGD